MRGTGIRLRGCRTCSTGELFGLEAGGHHASSLLLHTANAVLLLVLLRGMSGSLWRSAFVAALFGLHPLRLESVAWVFRAAVRIKPDYAEARSDLGLVLVLQGQLDEAIGHYQAALASRPNFEKAHYNLGRALALQGRREEAMQHYGAALRLRPNHAEALNSLAIALGELGRYAEAAACFRQLLALRPNDVDAHCDLANALQAQGQTLEAMGHYLEALRIRPEDADAREQLGLLQAQQGQVQSAITNFTELLRLRPSAPAHYHLGLARVMEGRRRSSGWRCMNLECRIASPEHRPRPARWRKGARAESCQRCK